MRLSANQKDILFVLYALIHKGSDTPVANTTLLRLINSSRSTAIHASNFRQSCHTLHQHHLLQKYRYQSLTLCWQLTAFGVQQASRIYTQRTHHANEQ